MRQRQWGEGNSWGITAHLLLPLNKLCKFNTLQGANPITDSCSPGTQYYIHPCITVNGKYSAPALHICGCPKIMAKVTLSTISPALLPGETSTPYSWGHKICPEQNLSRTKSVHCGLNTVPIGHSNTELICERR